MTPTELQNSLRQFTGTENYYRFSAIMPNVLLTDGANFLAQEAGAYWLMDLIGSHLPSVPKDEGFVIAHLKKHSNGAEFGLYDDLPPTRKFAEQHIEWTNFPLDSIKLYAARQDEFWVILLPGEY